MRACIALPDLYNQTAVIKEKIKAIGIYDHLIFFSVLLAGAGLFLYFRLSAESTMAYRAQIIADGEVKQTVSLKKEKRLDYPSFSAEVSGGKIRISRSNCPKKVCIRTGWISKPWESIVCVPEKVIVKIISTEEEEYDALTY